MASDPDISKTKPSPRLMAAKKRYGREVSERLEQIKKSKAEHPLGRGLTSEDLEALRDGRT